MSGDRTKAIEDAIEARESHVAWLEWWRHLEEGCMEPDCLEIAANQRREYAKSEQWGVPYEERWVAAYDNILACLGVSAPEIAMLSGRNGAAEELRAAVA